MTLSNWLKHACAKLLLVQVFVVCVMLIEAFGSTRVLVFPDVAFVDLAT